MLQVQIRKRLGEFELGVELTAPEERVIVLFGPSGAGKSLTLASIAGLTTLDAGRIAIGERVLFDTSRGVNLPPQQRHIGLVTQDLALFPHLSVAENIAYGLYQESRAVVRAQVSEFLSLMDLEGLGARRPAELSGGQQQRVALARALAIHPSLLLLDEPFSALDRAIRLQLRDELKAIQRHLHTTLLFVTHDLGEAYVLADYLAVIDRGQILQFDEPDQVLRAPSSLRVAELVGVKNILPATVVSAECVRVGARTLEIPRTELPTGARAFISIRPERVSLVREERASLPRQNMIEGDLIGEQSDGQNVSMLFRAEGARLAPGREFDLQVDTPVYVYERLNVASQRHWTISLKPSVIHLIAAEGSET